MSDYENPGPAAPLLSSALVSGVLCKVSTGEPISTNWMLSFGDLLTLLLGFFVLLVSVSTLNPLIPVKNVAQSQPVIPDDRAHAAPPNLASMAGTPLAELQEESSARDDLPTLGLKPSLRLGVGEVSEGGILIGDGAQKVQTFLRGMRTNVGPLILTVCALGEGAAAWKNSVKRADRFAAELAAQGVGLGMIEVDVLGPHCSLLNAPTGGEDARTQIMLSLE